MKYLDLPERYRSLENSDEEIRILAKPESELPIVFENRFVVLVNDRVRFPSGGGEGHYLRLFSAGSIKGSPGATGLARFQGVYYLVEIYRHPVRSRQIESPRGFGAFPETAEQTVRREVFEELGVPVQEVFPLGEVCPDSGMQASHVEMFLVELSSRPPKTPGLEARMDGIIAYHEFSKSELLAAIASGKIQDCFTLSVICAALAKQLL